MTLKDIKIKPAYSFNTNDDILNEFYIPALKVCNRYDRLAGYFTPLSILASSEGMSSFIRNGTKYRLVFNKYVDSHETVQSIIDGNIKKEELLKLSVDDIDKYLTKNPRKVMSWMIAKNLLEIKVAFKVPDDSYEHSKFGILKDSNNNEVAFMGSINESLTGWRDQINSTSTFRNWNADDFERIQFDYYSNLFDSYWNDKASKMEVVDFTAEINDRILITNTDNISQEEIIKIAKENDKKINELRSNEVAETSVKIEQSSNEPSPRGYQKESLENWLSNDQKGIFALATGLGKTWTSIFGIQQFDIQNDGKFMSVIVAPSDSLLKQWRTELLKFGYNSKILQSHELREKWGKVLKDDIFNLNYGVEDNQIFIISMKLYCDERFTKIISGYKGKSLLIVDEVHNAGSKEHKKGLLDSYHSRIGLTATPKRHFDEEGSNYLIDYFSGVVIERDLKWGIENKKLSPYNYHVIEVDLNEEEMKSYSDYSRAMAVEYEKIKKRLTNFDKYEALTRKRALIIKQAQNKKSKFADLLDELDDNLKGSFIFCPPGGDFLKDIGNILSKKNISWRRFISKDKDEDKKNALINFTKDSLQTIVAINCLNEGIDVPSANRAIILSSSSNPKEYIQRRGRVLRRSDDPNKVAEIHDFVCFPSLEDDKSRRMQKTLIKNQLKRFQEFSSIALNANSNNKILEKICNDWDINLNE
jgi:superfamily II DNA or RNA helicase